MTAWQVKKMRWPLAVKFPLTSFNRTDQFANKANIKFIVQWSSLLPKIPFHSIGQRFLKLLNNFFSKKFDGRMHQWNGHLWKYLVTRYIESRVKIEKERWTEKEERYKKRDGQKNWQSNRRLIRNCIMPTKMYLLMQIGLKETVKTFRLSIYCWLFGVLDFLGFEVPKFKLRQN